MRPIRTEAAECELDGPRITGPRTSLKMLGGSWAGIAGSYKAAGKSAEKPALARSGRVAKARDTMLSMLALMGLLFPALGSAQAPGSEAAPRAKESIDPCVGVWTIESAYVSVHASGRRVRHARDEAGAWVSEELEPFGHSVVAALQSKDAIHVIAPEGRFFTANQATGSFARHPTPLNPQPGWPGHLREVRCSHTSSWLVLETAAGPYELVECQGTTLRVAGTSDAGSFPLASPDRFGRVLFTQRMGKEKPKPIVLWRPTEDGLAILPLLGTDEGDWRCGSWIQGPQDAPMVLIGNSSPNQGGGGLHHELVAFEPNGRGSLDEARRVHTMGFLFGPHELRRAGDVLFTTAGAASVSAVHATSLATLWARPGDGSGMASTHTWTAADGSSLVAFGSADTLVLNAKDGSVITQHAAPPKLHEVRAAGLPGELIAVVTGHQFVILRDGGNWGILHTFR